MPCAFALVKAPISYIKNGAFSVQMATVVRQNQAATAAPHTHTNEHFGVKYG